MVVFGSQTGDAELALGPRDFIGLSIAFACVLAMAVFYVYVQKTEGLIGVEVRFPRAPNKKTKNAPACPSNASLPSHANQ